MNHAKYNMHLFIGLDEEFDHFEITDESWNNIRLDKLKSLSISGPRFVCEEAEEEDGEGCDYLLT